MECPGCGLDVTGWTVTVDDEGLRHWERPSYTTYDNSGRPMWFAGFTHIEGGMRCHR